MRVCVCVCWELGVEEKVKSLKRGHFVKVTFQKMMK